MQKKKKIIYVYCKVTASQAIHEQKSLWIIIKKIDEKGSNIISVWCSFMAGANRTCNHVIATLYKLEYANSKGWCNPACTETACQWNQGTYKKVKLKHIADLSVHKKLGSNTSKVDKEAPEETRMKHLQDFDLCFESHHNIIVDVSTFFQKLQLADENTVRFKSIESLGTTSHANFESVLIKSIVNKVAKPI